MEKTASDLLEIMSEIANEAAWSNRERFVQLARDAHAGARSSLLSSGHAVAAGRLGRQFTVSGWASEQLSGP